MEIVEHLSCRSNKSKRSRILKYKKPAYVDLSSKWDSEGLRAEDSKLV